MAKKWETKNIGEISYHSTRKEREESSISKKRESLSFFRRNPGFRLILFDLLLLVIIAGVIVPFIIKREGISELDNYKLTLKSEIIDENELYLTLIIHERKSINSSGIVELLFYTNMGEKNGQIEKSDLLPRSLSKRIINAKYYYNGEKYIYCRIRINGKNKIIKRVIR